MDERAKHIQDNFVRFNPYVERATDGQNEDADVYGLLSVAFELSQLRYLLRKNLDNHNKH